MKLSETSPDLSSMADLESALPQEGPSGARNGVHAPSLALLPSVV